METGALKGLRNDRCAGHLFRLLLLHLGVRVLAARNGWAGPASGTRRCLAGRVLEAAEEIEGPGAAVRGVVPQAKRGTGVGWAAVVALI